MAADLLSRSNDTAHRAPNTGNHNWLIIIILTGLLEERVLFTNTSLYAKVLSIISIQISVGAVHTSKNVLSTLEYA